MLVGGAAAIGEQQAALEAARDQVLGTAAELDTLPIVMEAMRDYHLLTFLRSVGCVCKHWHRVWQQTDSCLARLKRLCDEYDAVYDPMAGNTQAAATVAHELLDVLWLDHPGRLAQSIVSSVYNYRYTPDGRPILSGIGNIINAMLREAVGGPRGAQVAVPVAGAAWPHRVLRPADGDAPVQVPAPGGAAGAGGDHPAADVDEWQAAGVGKGDAHRLDAAQVGGVEARHAARQVDAPRQAAGAPRHRREDRDQRPSTTCASSRRPTPTAATTRVDPARGVQWVTPAGPDNHNPWQGCGRAPTPGTPSGSGRVEKHVAFEDTLFKRLDYVSRAIVPFYPPPIHIPKSARRRKSGHPSQVVRRRETQPTPMPHGVPALPAAAAADTAAVGHPRRAVTAATSPPSARAARGPSRTQSALPSGCQEEVVEAMMKRMKEIGWRWEPGRRR